MTLAKAKLRAKLTGADYLKLTPPSHRGVRYQLLRESSSNGRGYQSTHTRCLSETCTSLLRSQIELRTTEPLKSASLLRRRTLTSTTLFSLICYSCRQKAAHDGARGVTGSP